MPRGSPANRLRVRILVIEDQREIAEALRSMLERRKYAVELASDGDTGYDMLLRGTYDAAVIDVVLPGRDGFTLTRDARAEGISTPVLFLTARDAVEDRVRGLDAGADDYLVKPFVEDELAARLRALLRRAPLPFRSTIDVGDLSVDRGGRSVRVGGREVPLGATEFRLVEYLASNAGIALTRTQILERVWGEDFEGSSNVVDVYVSAIRRKLASVGARDRISTVWGVGYTLHA
ncbi:MAG TPA: response regulator transcription factor [Candidatus Acidoferrum sp.]|nr:response regulator transcription factor [Candidatus Acidoferrum sp.]